MIIRKQQKAKGLITCQRFRKAGQMADGSRTWQDAYQIFLLPVEEKEIFKYILDEDAVPFINKALETVHWGALVELELNTAGNVTGVQVIDDIFASYYEEEDM
ncbi:hypothetical protein [Faecalimonas umbilicata]|uniref:hypothetical protein n=1 Tax=Faecalimonas umbilicata TaxID=1912855 RepID=UPI0022E93E7C|nr:hypothetical protein [Faecalimonas umbilicata]